jgi:uncharacterized RDD family membrane protein YckC
MKFISLIICCCVALWANAAAEIEARLELNAQGEPRFFLTQEYSPLLSEPRQSLTWKGLPPLETTGALHASLWDRDQLYLVYPKSIFLAIPEQTLKLTQKAPSGFTFITMGKAFENKEGYYILLRQQKDGRFFRKMPDGTQLPIGALDIFRQSAVSPWASVKYPLLYIPQQTEVAESKICIFNPDFENCRFIDPELSELPAGICETERGVWFLPQNGIEAKRWDGEQLKHEKLPVIENTLRWLALAESQPQHFQAILETKEGLTYWNGKTSTNLQGPKVPTVQHQNRPLWQQTLLFGIMVGSFVVILRWRQEALLQRRTPPTSNPSPLWRRSCAFAMDFFILQTPTYLIGQALNFPQPPVIDIQMFSLQPIEQQMEILFQFSEMLANTLAIMMVLAFITNGLMEYFLGASLGKLFFNLRVVSLNPQKLTVAQVLVRNLLRLLDFILPIPPSFLFILFSKEKRSLADRCASTRVIQIS